MIGVNFNTDSGKVSMGDIEVESGILDSNRNIL